MGWGVETQILGKSQLGSAAVRPSFARAREERRMLLVRHPVGQELQRIQPSPAPPRPGPNTCTGQSSAWRLKSLCSCYSVFENWPRHFAITGSWVSFLWLALRQNSFRLQKGFVPGKRTQHDAFVSAECLCQTKEARYLPFLSSKEHRNPCIPLHFTQLLSFPQSHKQRQHQGISVSMNLRSYGRLGSP